MPKNFAFFQKPLDKFFYKFDNSEINRQKIFSASFKNIENRDMLHWSNITETLLIVRLKGSNSFGKYLFVCVSFF